MKPQSGRHARPAKSPFLPSWACFLQQGQLSAENSVGFCSFCFLCVPMWTGEWNRFPDTGRLGWFRMLSSAPAWSDIVWQQRCWSPEVRAPCRSVKPAWWLPSNGNSTLPLVSQTSVHSETSHSRTQRARHAPSVRARVQVWGYVSVEMVTVPSQKTWSRRWEHGTERCVPALSMSVVLAGVTQSFYLIKLVKVIHVFGWFTDPYEHIGASPTAPLGFRKQPRQTAGAGTKCVMGPSNKVSVLIVSIHWFHHLKLALWPYNGEKLGGSRHSDNRSC